jgi:hypothetical protein
MGAHNGTFKYSTISLPNFVFSRYELHYSLTEFACDYEI